MITLAALRERPWLLGLLGAGFVLILFCAAAAMVDPGGLTTPPQADTLMYFQYAQAIAQGHPYRYQAGDPCTTACTSHLYPFLLALPCWLGAQGPALVVCSLVLNVLSYLAVVVLAGLALRRLAPASQLVGTALVALSGPLALACWQQSDMAVFAALALGLFVTLVYERFLWAAVLLALVVWCRPEGEVMAGLLLLCALTAPGCPHRRVCLRLGIWGLVQVAGVLALNRALTGTMAFQSVICKGYLVQLPVLGAVVATTTDFGVLLREVVLGLPSSGRHAYALPLLGGLLLLLGWCARLSARDTRTTLAERWLASVLLVSLAAVAASGWQGFNHDRHLSWMFPFCAMYLAIGLAALAAHWPDWRAGWRLVGIALVVYQAAILPLFAVCFAALLQDTARRDAFIADVHAALPAGQRVGVVSAGYAAYLMPGRHVTHVGGYISTAFISRGELLANVEVLRHQPEQRFDVWLVDQLDAATTLTSLFRGACQSIETPVFPYQAALAAYQADWSTLAAPILPRVTNVIQSVAGMTLADRLDVGYLPEESAHDYRLFARVGNTVFHVAAATRWIGGARVTEAGRVIVGSETFRIHVAPHVPLRLILRTTTDLPADASAFEGFFPAAPLGFNADSRLNVLVDGESAGIFDVHLDTNTTVWSEVVLDLPADCIRRAQPEITVAGDHVAMCYWFYQPAAKRP